MGPIGNSTPVFRAVRRAERLARSEYLSCTGRDRTFGCVLFGHLNSIRLSSSYLTPVAPEAIHPYSPRDSPLGDAEGTSAMTGTAKRSMRSLKPNHRHV